MKKYIVSSKSSGKSKTYAEDEINPQELADQGYLVVDVDSGTVINKIPAPEVGRGEAFIQGIAEGGAGGFGLDYGNPARSALASESHPFWQAAGNITGDAAVGSLAGGAGALAGLKAAPAASKAINKLVQVSPKTVDKVAATLGAVVGAGTEGVVDAIGRRKPDDSISNTVDQAIATSAVNVLPFGIGAVAKKIPGAESVMNWLSKKSGLDDATKQKIKNIDDIAKAEAKSGLNEVDVKRSAAAQKDKVIDDYKNPPLTQEDAILKGAIPGSAGGGINAVLSSLSRANRGGAAQNISVTDPEFEAIAKAGGISHELVTKLRDMAYAEQKRPMAAEPFRLNQAPTDPTVRNILIRQAIDQYTEFLKKHPTDEKALSDLEFLKKL